MRFQIREYVAVFHPGRYHVRYIVDATYADERENVFVFELLPDVYLPLQVLCYEPTLSADGLKKG